MFAVSRHLGNLVGVVGHVERREKRIEGPLLSSTANEQASIGPCTAAGARAEARDVALRNKILANSSSSSSSSGMCWAIWRFGDDENES